MSEARVTARELAHSAMHSPRVGASAGVPALYCGGGDVHSHWCDVATAAIERDRAARDAEHGEQKEAEKNEVARRCEVDIDALKAENERLAGELAEFKDQYLAINEDCARAGGDLEEARAESRRLSGRLEEAEGLLHDADWSSHLGPDLTWGTCPWCGESAECPAVVANFTVEHLRSHDADCPFAVWYTRALAASPESAAPTAKAESDPYCELAASEIPGFGTNRDTHRCAKLHRDKPLLATGVPTQGKL